MKNFTGVTFLGAYVQANQWHLIYHRTWKPGFPIAPDGPIAPVGPY